MASVLITGTSSGIGMATALAFGRAGHQVAATMRNPDRAPELARIATQEKLPITISAIDVDSDASVKEGIGRIVKAGGPVDVLVNHAGIERTGSVEERRSRVGPGPRTTQKGGPHRLNHHQSGAGICLIT